MDRVKGEQESLVLQLVSHTLCPYVQRAVIVLAEKSVPYTRTYVDLGNPPSWFLAISPLGKVPLLRIGEDVLFESAVICEYLEETFTPALHPENAVLRAKHRAWMEFGSAILDNIWYFYTAVDGRALAIQTQKLHEKFSMIERQLVEGPYFSGQSFSMVDVVFGPIFRYFDVFDSIADFGVLSVLPKVQHWRCSLAQRESICNAVATDYPIRLREFLIGQKSEISRKLVTGS